MESARWTLLLAELWQVRFPRHQNPSTKFILHCFGPHWQATSFSGQQFDAWWQVVSNRTQPGNCTHIPCLRVSLSYPSSLLNTLSTPCACKHGGKIPNRESVRCFPCALRTVAKIEKHAPAPHRVLGRCLLNLTSAPWHSQDVGTCRDCKSNVFCAFMLHAQVLDMSVFQGKVAASVLTKNSQGSN